MSRTELAEHFGISSPRVTKILQDLNIGADRRGPKPSDLSGILKRMDKGESQTSIAQDLGMSSSSLTNMLARQGLTKLTAAEWREEMIRRGLRDK